MDTELERKPNDKDAGNNQNAGKDHATKSIERFSSLTKALLSVSRVELREQERKYENIKPD